MWQCLHSVLQNSMLNTEVHNNDFCFLNDMVNEIIPHISVDIYSF